MMQSFIPLWDGRFTELMVHDGHYSHWQDSVVKCVGMKDEDLAVALGYFSQSEKTKRSFAFREWRLVVPPCKA